VGGGQKNSSVRSQRKGPSPLGGIEKSIRRTSPLLMVTGCGDVLKSLNQKKKKKKREEEGKREERAQKPAGAPGENGETERKKFRRLKKKNGPKKGQKK